MRTRHSLAAAVVALAVILVGIIVSLLGGCGPTADVARPGSPPAGAASALPPSPSHRSLEARPERAGAYLAVESLDRELQ